MVMPVNMEAWRKIIEQGTDGIADEELQRRAWFGIGPEESSPEETINQFLGDAAIREFLSRKDAGLNELQIESGRHLVDLIEKFLKEMPQGYRFIDPSKLIDDPRWSEVREAATRFLALLLKPTKEN
jgi:isocitrate dehydrogenase kinase/phosphatase